MAIRPFPRLLCFPFTIIPRDSLPKKQMIYQNLRWLVLVSKFTFFPG